MRRNRGWIGTGLGLVLAVVACFAAATPATAQGALAKAKAAKALVVGISGGNAPIAWMSASDQPLGITLDFCQAMLKREGIDKIDVYTMPFGSLIPALTSGGSTSPATPSSRRRSARCWSTSVTSSSTTRRP